MFTLYWLGGKREVIKGSTVLKAFSSAGLGAGAVKALDFYTEGDNQEYTYDLKEHCWIKMIGKFVTVKLHGKDNCRQGWVISLSPLRIRGESGKIYLCEGNPVIVINPPSN